MEQLKCGCYRGSFCPTVCNSNVLSAEETLVLYNRAIYQRMPTCIKDFLPIEFKEKEVELHELFDNHWTDCYDDLKIFHSASDENDPDAVQVVAALVCLNDEFEEYERYDVITLRRDKDRGWWVISSVYKLLLNDEYKNPLMLPVFRSDTIFSATHEFLRTMDWNIEESDDADDSELIDLLLEVCRDARPDFDKLPQMAQAFYLEAVKKRYEEDNRIMVDVFSIEMN